MPHCSLDFLVLFVFQLLSHVRIFVTPWTAAHQDPMSLSVFQSAQVHVLVQTSGPNYVTLPEHPIVCIWFKLR